jgi:exopolysaccharide biosynthesis polyprenyl glycosylphosphotransferase
MLRRQKEINRKLRKLMDAGIFVLSFWLAYKIRSNWKIEVLGGTPEIIPFSEYAWLLLVIFPLASIVLQSLGFYDRILTLSRRVAARKVFAGCALLSVLIIMIMFLKHDALPRSVVIMFGFISAALILTKEQLLRSWVQSRWGKSNLVRRFVMVGGAADNARLRQELQANPFDGIAVLAELDLKTTPIEELANLLHKHSANGVILNPQHAFFGQIEKAIQICEMEGVEAWLLADFFKTQISKTSLDDLADRPVLVFRSTPEESWQAFAKQVIDFMGALGLLLLLSPLMLVVAVAIKRTSRGPVFFKQLRSGLNGQPFTMLKFRSMVSDAEQRKHELEALNEMSGPVFKVTNDPRVTPIGQWLRKKSIDELPQLWNVLRGDMSLVGPRPLPVDEVNRFDDFSHRRRLSVKPGLTCLWQVSGRNNVKDFKTWVRLDLEYIDNWSLWLDIKILLRTIPVVLLGTGAK